MMLRRSLLVVLAWFATACGGDGVHHLPDAPPLPTDGPSDAAIDAGPDQVGLHISKDGTGNGRISSTPDGILCGATCDFEFDRHTVVTLTAVAATDSVFTAWGGACTGTTPTCDVTLADAASVTATFTLQTFTVSVTKSGAGSGTVAGGALSCGATCSITVDYGTQLALDATPAALSSFAGWGGACSGMATCSLTVTADTAITANFALNDVTLFVSSGGNGTGTVTSSPAAIDCGTTCQHTYSAGDMTTLTAVPATGSTFTGWSGGGCTGTGPCTMTMTAATTVTATFTLQTFTLTVARAGNGSGAVTSLPAGIACGTACSALFDYGTQVTLTPAASTGSTFTGWSGACTGTGACVVTIAQAATVTATFTLNQLPLTVSKLGTGSGTVTGGPINCGTTCMASVSYGTMVTLTAAAAMGSTFTGWGGACMGTGACTVTMDMARSVTATFALQTFTVTATKAGNGAGTIAGGMINCGATCAETVPYNTVVTLTATPATGSTFTGWSGACTNTTGNCVTTVTMAETVTATFTLKTFTVTATKAGNGAGTVAGGMINCGATCAETVNYNTVVTLTASPAAGSTFTGWSGACTNATGNCVTTVTAAETATATFTLQMFTLTVTPLGTGLGTVTGPGIACGSTCSETVNYNTMITLTAASAAGSNFTGWGGSCSGIGTCTVTMDMARTVTATFIANVTLTLAKNGSGAGTVTGGGLDCGNSCSASLIPGTMVTLTATPDTAPATASTFAGWSGGGCAGLGTCTVTVNTATTVTATFTLKPNLIFATTSLQTGSLMGLPGADKICNTLAAGANLPGNYVAYLSAPGTNAPSRVGAAQGWVRVDGKPVMNKITEFAGGTMFNPPSVMENGVDTSQSQSTLAWTGTTTAGTYANACSAALAFIPWGGTSGSANMGLTTSTMSNAVFTDITGCGAAFRLYCLGIDRTAIAQ